MGRPRDEGMDIRILEAAIQLFGEGGFEATTLKQIAKAAGISSGSVYTYFSDKDSLFSAAVHHGWGRFLAELESLSDHRLPRMERVAALLDRGFVTLERALPLLRGMLFDASRKRLLDPSIERVTTAIDRILEPDYPDSGDHRTIAEKYRRNIIRIFVNGILFTTAFNAGQDSVRLIAELKSAVLLFLESYEKQDPQAVGALISGRKPS